MLYFSTPYAFDQRLAIAYDREFERLPSDEDWLCITDGDTAFLRADFGLHIQQYIDKYPGTGLFSCYASRCHYKYLIPNDGNEASTDILFHKKIADIHAKNFTLVVKEVNANIAGHLMVIQKKTWLSIRAAVLNRAVNETLEAVDTAISKAILAGSKKILVMRGIYIFHYCRLAEGYSYRRHLGYKNFINIITPCSRITNLETISKSINIPWRVYRWLVIIDAHKPAVLPTLPANAEVYYFKDDSVCGHGQRNYALNLLKELKTPKHMDPFVYFLDDDTTLHPDLYTEMKDLTNDFIHFNQVNKNGTHRIGGQVKVNHIDTGSAVIKLSLVQDLKWKTDIYNADGYFMEACFAKAKTPIYIPKPLSIYNGLQ